MKSRRIDVSEMEISIEKGSRTLQYICALSVSLIVMESGVSLAWTSPTIIQLKRADSEIPITELGGALLISIYFCGCLFGCLVSPFTMERFGRKNSFLLFSIPVIIGWIMITTAWNFYVLCIARLIIGLGDGGLLEFISIYLGEITEKEIRGKLSIVTKSAMLIGVFYEIAVGTYFSFRTSNLISVFIPVLFVITFLFMPESPYVYMYQDREKDAMLCLMKLRGFRHPESVKEDFDVMKKAVVEKQQCKRHALRELICSKSNRKRLCILLIAKMTRNLSGSVAILTSLHEIAKQSGNSNNVVLYVCSVKIIASFLSSQLIDRVGRRVIFLTCGIICTSSLVSLGMFFFAKLYLHLETSSVAWLPVISLFAYEFGYYTGLSPVGYVLQGELFPLKVKSMAVAFGSVVEQFLSFGIGFGFPLINYFFGLYISFWIFAICCLTGTLLVFYITPETKGKTLEEVEILINPPSKKVLAQPLLIRSK